MQAQCTDEVVISIYSGAPTPPAGSPPAPGAAASAASSKLPQLQMFLVAAFTFGIAFLV